MNKTVIGIFFLVAGAIGLGAVYSMRPPAGFGDALMMMGQGRDFFLKEPLYEILMAVSGVLVVLGIIELIGANKNRKS